MIILDSKILGIGESTAFLNVNKYTSASNVDVAAPGRKESFKELKKKNKENKRYPASKKIWKAKNLKKQKKIMDFKRKKKKHEEKGWKHW